MAEVTVFSLASDGLLQYDDLTPRQKEVLALIAEGYANTEIARRLFISVETVRTHVKEMRRKADLPHRRDQDVYFPRIVLARMHWEEMVKA